VLVQVDVLRRLTKREFGIIEVKSATSLKSHHVFGSGYISRAKVPHRNTIINYMGNDRLTAFLLSLIEHSARLLAPFEEDFAMDSTGYTTSRVSWSDYKKGKEDRCSQHDWVKVHLACGVRTHVVTAVVIKGQNAADSPQFRRLLAVTHGGFRVKAIMADKGYSSIENMQLVADIGATPFIAFTKTATGAGGGMFSKMFHYLRLHPDEFYERYHQRSNVEAAFSMMKRKFAGRLRSRTETAMKNETLCKVLCHNIAVLNHAMYSLGVEFDFAHSRLIEPIGVTDSRQAA